MENYCRGNRFIGKFTYIPDRICNNPSVGFADTSLYTREAFLCEALPTPFSESGHPFVSCADIFPNREITLYTRETFCVRLSHSLYTRDILSKILISIFGFAYKSDQLQSFIFNFPFRSCRAKYAFARTSTDL